MGDEFSPSFVPRASGRGRFDLLGERILYAAETPDHAVAEKIARYRGHRLTPAHLREFGFPLSIVRLELSDIELIDLCDPEILHSRSIHPDRVAARDRDTTQAIASRIADSGAGGLRWWSRFKGEWHTTVVFVDRQDSLEVQCGEPRPLEIDDFDLDAAMEALGMRT